MPPSFADGEDQLPGALGAWDVEGNWRGAAEIEVVGVEISPVRRCEIVTGRDRAGEVGTEAQHGLVAPSLDEEGVAGRDELRLPSLVTPPCAQMPPSYPSVEKLTTLPGSAVEKPMTLP